MFLVHQKLVEIEVVCVDALWYDYYRLVLSAIHCVSKIATTLIMSNCYKLEPILIILDTLYAETTGF